MMGKVYFFLFMISLGLPCLLGAKVDFSYRILPEAKRPQTASLAFIDQSFHNTNLRPIDPSHRGLIHLIGVDQVWMDETRSKKIYVKLGFETVGPAPYPLGLIPLLDGLVGHLKLPTGIMASVFFRGVPAKEAQSLLNQIQTKTSSLPLGIWPISSAYAEDTYCRQQNDLKEVEEFSGELQKIMAREIALEVLKCFASYSTSANQTAKELFSIDFWRQFSLGIGNAVIHPIDFYQKVVHSTDKLLEGSLKVSLAIQDAWSREITIPQMKSTISLLCSTSGSFFAGILTGKGFSEGAFRLAQRLSMSKLKNSKDVLNCANDSKNSDCVIWKKILDDERLADNDEFWKDLEKIDSQSNLTSSKLETLMQKHLDLPAPRVSLTNLLKTTQPTSLISGQKIYIDEIQKSLTLQERLGTGGSGVVYKVRLEDGSEAALKLPLNKMRESSLKQEIENIKQFEVAGIPVAKLYQADPKGKFMLSEIIEGPSTESYISKGLGEEQVRNLAEIYRKGKSHNLQIDLKPDNLKWHPEKKSFIFVDRGLSGGPSSQIYDRNHWNRIFFRGNDQFQKLFNELISKP